MAKIIPSSDQNIFFELINKIERQDDLQYTLEKDEDDSILKVSLSYPEVKNPLVFYIESISENIVNSNFDKYRYLKNYDAIWSAELSCIEFGFTDIYEFKRAIRILKIKKNKIPKSLTETEEFLLKVQPASIEYLILNDRLPVDSQEFAEYIENEQYVIKIKVKKDWSTEVLEKAAEFYNQFLFFLHQESGCNILPKFSTVNSFKSIYPSNLSNNAIFSKKINIERINLYWTAISLTNLPTLSYLLLYQIIENSFNNPRKEKLQLINKISDKIEIEELKDLLTNEECSKILNEELFNGNLKRIIINSPTLLDDFGSRIYQLRCAIAHTKSVEFKIFPNDTNISDISSDLVALSYIAKKFLHV